MDTVDRSLASVANNDRMWAAFCHAAALSVYIGIPFGHLIGPLVIWLLKKDAIALVADQGKESLNFQLSMTLYAVGAGLLALILIGIPLLILIILADLVLTVLASVKANSGEAYHYPLTIRFIK